MADATEAGDYEIDNGKDDSELKIESGKVDIITSTYTS